MMFDNFLKIGDVKLYYKVYGSPLEAKKQLQFDQPTLIIAHGGPGLDHSIHAPFWSRFEDNYQVLVYDQRGQGRSDASSPDQWHLKQWADDLHHLINKLNITKPVPVGISFGGHVCLQYALTYPQEPFGLILSDTEAKQDLNEIICAYRKVGGENAAQAAKNVFTNTCTETLQQYSDICVPHFQNNPKLQDSFYDCILRLDVTRHYNLNEHFRFDFRNQLHLINQCQTLILSGTIGPMHRLHNAELMYKNLPDELAKIAIMEDAGTPVFNHYPDEIEDEVRRFITSCIAYKQ